MIYLPFNTPEACVEEVKKYAGVDSIIGYSVVSTRNKPVHHNNYMKLYAMMEESGKPFAFHSGFNWNDPSFLQLNRFISMHALSFVHYSLIHMTNWIINGLPERFPKLKVLWVESGLAWIPYLMQRLDHEYQMRTCEAPLLKRLPSEYMRDMFYTQPADGEDQPEAAPGDHGSLQRRDAAALRVRLAALGFRRAELDHHAAVPERAGQAQHPRAQRRAHLQSQGGAQAAEGCGRAGGAAEPVLTMAVSVQPDVQTASLGDDFVAAAERALSSGQPGQVSDADLERVMTAAVRLYAAKADTDQPPAQPVTPSSVTPTDIVVTVSGLIKAAGLNLWDVSMWFNRAKR